ncbi:MAG TPA: GNAT family N-acetyltransferase [Chloroflexia bacterium]|nr:GNAT family N-acetyltransferase [Chloroflexia bacterium]
MENISHRPFQHESDYDLMRELVRQAFALEGPPDYATVGDLDWWRFTEEDPDKAIQRAELWLNQAGEAVGFVWPNESQADMVSHPDYRKVEAEMLAWCEQWRRENTPADVNEIVNTIYSYERDSARNTLLEQSGYTRTQDYTSYRFLRLDDYADAPVLPEGYTIRAVLSEEEAEARAEVHRSAFTSSKLNGTRLRNVMRSQTYRQNLDLVAVAQDGSFAAFCIVWYDEVNRVGVFDPVGCHPDHRRHGLTKAILKEGLRQLTALGADKAVVVNWWEEEAPPRLYDSVGFREIGRNYAWTKDLKVAIR